MDLPKAKKRPRLAYNDCFVEFLSKKYLRQISILGTVNSRFKKVHFSFLKSRVVWCKKDLCSESKNRSSEKNALCSWICNLRSFLNREFTVLTGNHKDYSLKKWSVIFHLPIPLSLTNVPNFCRVSTLNPNPTRTRGRITSCNMLTAKKCQDSTKLCRTQHTGQKKVRITLC